VWVHASEISVHGFHVTCGGGLRLIWGTFVVSADVGFYQSPAPRVYVTTGHPF